MSEMRIPILIAITAIILVMIGLALKIWPVWVFANEVEADLRRLTENMEAQ